MKRILAIAMLTITVSKASADTFAYVGPDSFNCKQVAAISGQLAGFRIEEKTPIQVVVRKAYSVEKGPEADSTSVIYQMSDDHTAYQIDASNANLKALKDGLVSSIIARYQEISYEFDEVQALTVVECFR